MDEDQELRYYLQQTNKIVDELIRYKLAVVKLCTLMEKDWGRKNEGGYCFPTHLPTVISSREECLPEDFLTWIESQSLESDE